MEVGQGEVGEVAVPMVDLGREEGVEVVRTTTTATTTTLVEVPVVVWVMVVVVVAEQEGDEEVHHLHHLPDHLLPQTICQTKTFSLVSPFFALHLSGLTLWNTDDDPPPPPPPRRSEPPPKSNPAPRTTKTAAPPKPQKTTATVTTAATTTTKPTARRPPPAPVPSTSTVPYCECGYPALETSIILAGGPPCKQWGCGNLGKCEFFQVDKNPVPVPLIPQKRQSPEYVGNNLLLGDSLVLLSFVESCDKEDCEPVMSL